MSPSHTSGGEFSSGDNRPVLRTAVNIKRGKSGMMARSGAPR